MTYIYTARIKERLRVRSIRVMRFFSMTCGNEVTSTGRSVRHAAKDLPEENVVYYYFLFLLLLSRLLYTSIHTHAYNTRVYFRIYFASLLLSFFFFPVRFSMERINNPPTQVFFFFLRHLIQSPTCLLSPPPQMGFFFPSSSLFFCTRNENDDLPGMLVDWMSWMSIYIIYLNDRKIKGKIPEE